MGDLKKDNSERKGQKKKGKKNKAFINQYLGYIATGEPINIFGDGYVATVLDALQNKHITLNKATTHLDNLKIRTLHKLEGDFV